MRLAGKCGESGWDFRLANAWQDGDVLQDLGLAALSFFRNEKEITSIGRLDVEELSRMAIVAAADVSFSISECLLTVFHFRLL